MRGDAMQFLAQCCATDHLRKVAKEGRMKEQRPLIQMTRCDLVERGWKSHMIRNICRECGKEMHLWLDPKTKEFVAFMPMPTDDSPVIPHDHPIAKARRPRKVHA